MYLFPTFLAVKKLCNIPRHPVIFSDNDWDVHSPPQHSLKFHYHSQEVIGSLGHVFSGSTISTLLHDRINPKDCQVLSLGDSGFLQFFRVVSSDYGKPRFLGVLFEALLSSFVTFVGKAIIPDPIRWAPLADQLMG